MHQVEKTRETKHSPESVWEALASFNQIERFHPAVKSSPGSSREQFGVGAARVCHFNDGTSVREVVTEVVEGRSMVIELSEFSMPLREASVLLTVEPSSTGATIRFSLRFMPKYGPIGALMAKAMIKPMMGKMIDGILEGLDEYLSRPVAA